MFTLPITVFIYTASFVLYYKRLGSPTFEHFPYDINVGSYQLDYTQTVMLVDGICIKNLHRKKHYEVMNSETIHADIYITIPIEEYKKLFRHVQGRRNN